MADLGEAGRCRRRRPSRSGCRRGAARESAPRSPGCAGPARRSPRRRSPARPSDSRAGCDGRSGLRDRPGRPSPRPWSACRPASPVPPSAVSSCSTSCGDQPIRRGPRLVGDGGAGEHAGDLLAPGRPVEGDDAGQIAGFAAALLHPPVMGRLRRDLGRMGDDQHLALRPRAVPAARRRRPPWRRRCRCRPRRRPGSGALPEPASTTLSASMNRASSPPEAMRPMGPGAAPGLVATSKAMRSCPRGPHCGSASRSSRVAKLAFSSFSGGSSASTALSSLAAVLRRAAERRSAASI